MKRIPFLIAVAFIQLYCFSIPSLKLIAKTEIDPRIITFDKLTKTIIDFSSDISPTVKIQPSLHGKYILAYAHGKGTITFPSPVPIGTYTITLSAGKRTAKCEWVVLPTQLDSSRLRGLASMKLYYGKRLSIRTRLIPEAELPLQQFKIDYQLGTEKANIDNAYSESWVGPNIPATAKTVQIAVVWVYPPTGERVPLFSRTITPDQVPPDITYTRTSEIRTATLNSQTRSLEFLVKGISVDYNVPIDADNRDSNASKSLKATLNDIEVDSTTIDYTSTDTYVRIYKGDEPDSGSPWLPNATTFRIQKTSLDGGRGAVSLSILVKELPPIPANETRFLKGIFSFKPIIKINNRKAGVSANAISQPYFVLINIPFRFASTASVEDAQQRNEARNSPIGSANFTARLQELCAGCSNVAAQYPFWRITSPALREKVQAYLFDVGGRLTLSAPGTTTPLVVNGENKGNGNFSLFSLRIGDVLVTKRKIDSTLNIQLKDFLERPITEEGNAAYQYDVLSAKEQEQEREQTRNLALIAGDYEGKAVLQHLDYYIHAGYALFEADSAVIQRLNGSLTPCDCKAYVVAQLHEKTPRIIGIVTTSTATKEIHAVSTITIKKSLEAPTAVYDAAYLRSLNTREIVYDSNNDAPVLGKGSIIGTTAYTIYEYCLQGIRSGAFIDRTADVMPFPAVKK
ncbi:MAG: hypothetical protein ACOVSW_12665 [Candidatus Kapaibacteriota bacterium]